MFRIFLTLLGLAALVTAGILHGMWTDRWQPSDALIHAQASLENLPTEIGTWKSEPYEQDPEALALAGAVGHYSRTFIEPRTGEKVLVMLLVGRATRMVVHRPEHCYRAAGYEMLNNPIKLNVQPKGEGPGSFSTSVFSREDSSGPNQLRIYWSFYTGDRWETPTNPRLEFANRSVLFKLYVIRNIPDSKSNFDRDPCVQLLGMLLPILNRTLAVS